MGSRYIDDFLHFSADMLMLLFKDALSNQTGHEDVITLTNGRDDSNAFVFVREDLQSADITVRNNIGSALCIAEI